jgi:hypothetical protein
MANPHVAHQALHVASSEYILHQAVGFLLGHATILAGYYTGGILPAMLEYGQRIIQLNIHIPLTDNTYNAAHTRSPFLQKI